MKALVFGSLNLDYVYRVPHFVSPGETLSALEQTVKAGGKGLNQSIALSRAGAEAWHAGCVGVGGELLLEELKRSGVRTGFVRPVSEIQGNAVIQVNPDGENCILLFGGSNQCVTETQIEETLSVFTAGDWLILQNEINMLPRIVNIAHSKGLRIVLNPSPFNEKIKDVDFKKLDWILLNEIEAEQLSGCSQPEDVWTQIHALYPELSVLLTLGQAGSMAWEMANGQVRFNRQTAFKVKAVDTTAAGDTYTGYFIHGLMQGQSLEICMKTASKASAIAVSRPGAADSIPTMSEVISWIPES